MKFITYPISRHFSFSTSRHFSFPLSLLTSFFHYFPVSLPFFLSCFLLQDYFFKISIPRCLSWKKWKKSTKYILFSQSLNTTRIHRLFIIPPTSDKNIKLFRGACLTNIECSWGICADLKEKPSNPSRHFESLSRATSVIEGPTKKINSLSAIFSKGLCIVHKMSINWYVRG